MNRYRLLFSIILLLCFSPCLRAGEWQWSVTLDGFVSNETNRNPTAFLWIPADCMRVKTILVGQHNMSEETLFDNPLFREKMQKLGIGFVWITPGIDQQWDVSKGTQRIFEKMMADLNGKGSLEKETGITFIELSLRWSQSLHPVTPFSFSLKCDNGF